MTNGSPDTADDFDRVRFAAIIASSDDAIVSKDLDGIVRSWNPAAERIFGYTAAEMIGQPIFKVVPPELHDDEREILARIRQGEHIAHYEVDRIRKDGRRIRISLTLSPLTDREGRLMGASAIKRDVTAQRSLEVQLNQALRMEAVGRLAGGIAHDFNNLLTVIGGLATLTAARMAEGTRERRDLDQVVDAAQRATALTQQLLTFSRRQLADIEVLEPGNIVSGLEVLLHRLIGEHIELRTIVAPDLGRVRANRSQIEQVVMNLVINARDAMPAGGSLTIEAANVEVAGHFAREQLRLEPGAYVMLSVSDTGEGMDAVTQATIFEPFFTTKGPGHGTGLGLATVYAIVQQAGGAIYVYSELGRGSVFKVYLPRVDAPSSVRPATDAPAYISAAGTRRGCILLAEDEPGVRSFCAQVLEDAGYSVVEAATGEEALDRLASMDETPVLLLTDVVMPGMNGRILSERVRALRPGVPILFMSGYTDDMVVRTGVVAEGAAFLQKPFTPQGLVDRVRSTALSLSPQAKV